MGWFDTVSDIIDVATQVADVVVPVVGAIIGEQPQPTNTQTYMPQGYPMTPGAGGWSPGLYPQYVQQPGYMPVAPAVQYQAQQQQMQGLPTYPSYNAQTGASGYPSAGGFYDPVSFQNPVEGGLWDMVTPGGPGGGMFPTAPFAGSSAGANQFFAITPSGRPRTKNVIEALDWNGERRYWVGGVKMAQSWIKKMVLSSQRRHHHHHHGRHHHSKH